MDDCGVMWSYVCWDGWDLGKKIDSKEYARGLVQCNGVSWRVTAERAPRAIYNLLTFGLFGVLAMTASQMRIAETIDTFYGEAGTRDGVSRSYKQAVEELDAETIKALDGPYRTTVVEPISRFCAYFPDINECMISFPSLPTPHHPSHDIPQSMQNLPRHSSPRIMIGIKKRNHKLLDYDQMRAKVKKLVEKPDNDPGKLPRVWHALLSAIGLPGWTTRLKVQVWLIDLRHDRLRRKRKWQRKFMKP